MRVADHSAGAIKSGGGTRRAAKMVILDVEHPDIEEFIWLKVREEEKSRALRAAGYEGNAIEEAQVDFQNANHSVRVSDDFMEPATLHAAMLFNQIAEAAHACGDPGLHFGDTINRWHTVPNSDSIESSNPCSEFFFINNSACNLASINLLKFLKDDGTFDIPAFRNTVDILITAQDILCGRSDYPTKKIGLNSLNFRPLGLGYTNLGATLMAQGMPYDSDEGRKFAGKVTSLMTAEAYLQSARMAEQLGAFAGYEANKEEVLNVLTMHHAANDWFDSGRVWADARELAEQHGVRNAQVTLLAPTGTISFMMDAETTGIEPLMSIEHTKKLVGGGMFKTISRVAEQAIFARGLDADQAETSFILQTALGSNPLSWQAHVKMVAAVQPFLSGGVSKTINMPAEATVEDVKSAYLMAWELGLKSIAIYRDGSKTIQPVCVASREGQPLTAESLSVEVRPTTARRRLADERPAINHKFSVDGYEGYLTVGLFENGQPGELFLRMSKEGSTLGGLCDALGVAVSLGLQYGVPLEALVEKYQQTKFEPMGMTNNPDIPIAQSIVDYIFRWLGKKFLGESAIIERNIMEVRSLHVARRTNGHAPICPECGNLMMQTGTCSACPACGTSGGCA
jgi:ribonucleoside-diphosphate reductase alpha chain